MKNLNSDLLIILLNELFPQFPVEFLTDKFNSSTNLFKYVKDLIFLSINHDKDIVFCIIGELVSDSINLILKIKNNIELFKEQFKELKLTKDLNTNQEEIINAYIEELQTINISTQQGKGKVDKINNELLQVFNSSEKTNTESLIELAELASNILISFNSLNQKLEYLIHIESRFNNLKLNEYELVYFNKKITDYLQLLNTEKDINKTKIVYLVNLLNFIKTNISSNSTLRDKKYSGKVAVNKSSNLLEVVIPSVNMGGNISITNADETIIGSISITNNIKASVIISNNNLFPIEYVANDELHILIDNQIITYEAGSIGTLEDMNDLYVLLDTIIIDASVSHVINGDNSYILIEHNNAGSNHRIGLVESGDLNSALNLIEIISYGEDLTSKNIDVTQQGIKIIPLYETNVIPPILNAEVVDSTHIEVGDIDTSNIRISINNSLYSGEVIDGILVLDSNLLDDYSEEVFTTPELVDISFETLTLKIMYEEPIILEESELGLLNSLLLEEFYELNISSISLIEFNDFIHQPIREKDYVIFNGISYQILDIANLDLVLDSYPVLTKNSKIEIKSYACVTYEQMINNFWNEYLIYIKEFNQLKLQQLISLVLNTNSNEDKLFSLFSSYTNLLDLILIQLGYYKFNNSEDYLKVKKYCSTSGYTRLLDFIKAGRFTEINLLEMDDFSYQTTAIKNYSEYQTIIDDKDDVIFSKIRSTLEDY